MEHVDKKVQKKPNGAKSIMIAVVIGVAIFAVGYVLYVLPAVRQAQQLRDESPEILDMQLADKQAQLNTLQKRLQSYNKLSPELLEKLDESLPTEPREVDLLVNIQALVEASGLTLQSISIDSGESVSTGGAKEVRTLNITLSLEGMSYSHLKRFISNVESNNRLLRLSDLSYSPGNTGYGVTLSAFYYQ